MILSKYANVDNSNPPTNVFASTATSLEYGLLNPTRGAIAAANASRMNGGGGGGGGRGMSRKSLRKKIKNMVSRYKTSTKQRMATKRKLRSTYKPNRSSTRKRCKRGSRRKNNHRRRLSVDKKILMYKGGSGGGGHLYGNRLIASSGYSFGNTNLPPNESMLASPAPFTRYA